MVCVCTKISKVTTYNLFVPNMNEGEAEISVFDDLTLKLVFNNFDLIPILTHISGPAELLKFCLLHSIHKKCSNKL